MLFERNGILTLKYAKDTEQSSLEISSEKTRIVQPGERRRKAANFSL